MPDEEKIEKKEVDEKRVVLETKAKAKGWKPEDEYKGENEWVDAKEFLGRETFFEKIKQNNTEIKTLKEQLAENTEVIKNMTEHFKKARDADVKKAIDDLKSQRKEAISTGDAEKVEEIDSRIEEQKKLKEDTPSPTQIRPEVNEWINKNPWYLEDEKLREDAIAFTQSYQKTHPTVSLTECLSKTKDYIKFNYPDKFPDNTSRRETAQVETPSGAETGKKKGYGRDRLISDAQRHVYDQAEKAGIYIDKKTGKNNMEEYVRELEKIGELKI